MRYFNTEGICKPKVHYMVRLDDRLQEIRRLYIDQGKYFVINRGRQYGKTTTLTALADFLSDAYAVLPMDFQRISAAGFADEQAFSEKFIAYVEQLALQRNHLKEMICQDALQALTEQKDHGDVSMDLLFAGLSRICATAKRPVVLMIDEVDSASGHEVFIEFLSQLRAYYLDRENSPMFHSVILAGVYDIKNLKRRIRPDGEQRYNSPWNIAADFDMEMGFSAAQIQGMLEEYEKDRHTGMQTAVVSDEIYQYTAGYPYLVSAVCKAMDEKLPETLLAADSAVWTKEGVTQAVKLLLDKRLPLFDSMMRQISEYQELKQMLYAMLFWGETFAYNPDHNGIGNYYIESQTRDARRTDVIVDYAGEQFIIEMKIWHGEEYNRRGEQQLLGYLDSYHVNRGYLLSFNFNQNKTVGVRKIQIGDKTIVEAVV